MEIKTGRRLAHKNQRAHARNMQRKAANILAEEVRVLERQKTKETLSQEDLNFLVKIKKAREKAAKVLG